MARTAAGSGLGALTSRERQALRYFVRGYTPAEAARCLGLAVFEVEQVRKSIFRKLDLGSRRDVYEYAVAVGLVARNGKA